MNTRKHQSGGLVYSTESGRMCPGCEKPVAQCICKTVSLPQGDGIVRIELSTSGRKGKGVTLLSGFALDEPALQALGKELRRLCGTGGTVKQSTIEIQGDQREKVLAALSERGFKTRLIGK